MTIKSKERTFNYTNEPGKQEFTKYYVEIVEKKEGNPSTFILTESENRALPIGQNLVSAVAGYVAEYYGLKGHQLTIFAEMRNGNFTKFSFRDYRPTIDAEPQIDIAPNRKIEVSREYVENQVAIIERWKELPQVEFNWEESSLTPHSKIVQNPDKQQEQMKKPESEREL